MRQFIAEMKTMIEMAKQNKYFNGNRKDNLILANVLTRMLKIIRETYAVDYEKIEAAPEFGSIAEYIYQDNKHTTMGKMIHYLDWITSVESLAGAIPMYDTMSRDTAMVIEEAFEKAGESYGLKVNYALSFEQHFGIAQ